MSDERDCVAARTRGRIVRGAGRVDRVVRAVRASAGLKPVVATRRVLAFTTGLLYLAGGGLVLLSVRDAGLGAPHRSAIAFLGATAVIIGAATLTAGRQLPGWSYHVLVGLGTVIITALVSLSGGGASALGFGSLYTFVAIDCFFFFAWPAAVAHLAGFQICSAAAFAYLALPLSQTVVQQGCATVVALVVGWLARAAAAAEQDCLTRLMNRRGLDRTLHDAIAAARRDVSPLCVVLLDLDHFKAINDSGGHASGDQVLRFVAQTWTGMLRPGQTLARPGGDEFALVLPGCPLDRAAALADQLRAAVGPRITCSAGVAELDPRDSRAMLINRADAALYQAKAAGRNRTAQPGTGHPTRANEIQDALADGQFDLHYQPIVALHGSSIDGEEALIRWIHPTRGMIAPNDFIPDAERSGAIHDLGLWVLRRACRHAALAGTAASHLDQRLRRGTPPPRLRR